MSTWVSAAPVIGAGSLDGFAIGALMTGACALAVTAPRRTRGRKGPSARDAALAAERGGWLCEHVMAAEVVGAEVAAEAAVAGGSPALAAAPVLTSGVPMTGETPPGLTSDEMAPGHPPAPPPGLVAPGLIAEAVASALAAAPAGPVWTADAADLTLAAPAPAGSGEAADAADLTLAPAAAAPVPAAEAFEASAERLAGSQELGASRPTTGRTARAAGSYRSRHRLGTRSPADAGTAFRRSRTRGRGRRRV